MHWKTAPPPPQRRTSLTRFGSDSIVVTDGSARFALPDLDFNVLSFRSNAVLRWEWRAGSTVYLVWQQRRGSQTTADRPVRPGALWDALSASGDNFVTLTVSYWFVTLTVSYWLGVR